MMPPTVGSAEQTIGDDLEVARCAVGVAQAQLGRDARGRSACRLVKQVERRGAVLRVHQVAQIHVFEGGRRVTPHTLRRGAVVANRAIGGDDHDHI